MAGRRAAVTETKRVRKTNATLELAQPEAPAQAREIHLGIEIDVVGSIYIDAHVRLEGNIDGEIRCQELDIGKQARVRGLIVAERVTVYGTVVEGSIFANVLILRPGCMVEAEIYHKHLQLEQGSYFDGKSRRVADPTAMAPT